jgi:hypothetical protein
MEAVLAGSGDANSYQDIGASFQLPGRAYLSDMINVYQPQTCQRHLQSAGILSLVVPRAQTQYDERQFSFSSPTLWNQIPDSIQL